MSNEAIEIIVIIFFLLWLIPFISLMRLGNKIEKRKTELLKEMAELDKKIR